MGQAQQVQLQGESLVRMDEQQRRETAALREVLAEGVSHPYSLVRQENTRCGK